MERCPSPIGESFAQIVHGNWHDALTTLRHEGLKHGVEWGLHLLGSWHMGCFVLNRMAGETVDDKRLQTSIGPLQLKGPVGLAPGWDKTGNAIRAWQEAGASHHTTGGVTLRPQRGKPRPRLHTFDQHVGDHGKRVSLNSYGFPSPGAEAVARNIAAQQEKGASIPVIVQVVPNAEMYSPDNIDRIPYELAEVVSTTLKIAEPHAINLGLSSPNTAGMREGQHYDFMHTVVVRVLGAIARSTNRNIPLIYKGDADGGLKRLDMYCRLAEATGTHLELINTTANPGIKAKYHADGLPGGLAGADPDYQVMATQAVSYAYQQVGDKVNIIGVGGIDTPMRARAMIEAGASAVSINTAIRALGIGVFRYLEYGISATLGDDQSLTELIGVNAHHNLSGD